MTYLSNMKNWKVELDEIVVTAKRPKPTLPWGVNYYKPQDPGEWLQRSNMRIAKGDLSVTTNYYDGSFNRLDRTQGGATQRKQVLYLAGDAYSAPAALVRIGVNSIPKIGPFISTVIGLADAFYGEYLYDWVDSTF